ncbi:MAG: uracil-DNA glycosylase [Spirochaetes bacterium]|nr:MAG: uracil-DNA glycosylase [Spirochaetota bacterium]
MKSAECKWFPVCPMNYFHSRGMLRDEQIYPWCKGDWFSCRRYQMEERGQFHPDNMLPDGTIDESLKY